MFVLITISFFEWPDLFAESLALFRLPLHDFAKKHRDWASGALWRL
jgi:hypothetical protein